MGFSCRIVGYFRPSLSCFPLFSGWKRGSNQSRGVSGITTGRGIVDFRSLVNWIFYLAHLLGRYIASIYSAPSVCIFSSGRWSCSSLGIRSYLPHLYQASREHPTTLERHRRENRHTGILIGITCAVFLFSTGLVFGQEVPSLDLHLQAGADDLPFPVWGLASLEESEFSEKREALLQYKAERGVGEMELLSSAILREGDRAIVSGEIERALALGELAKSLSPHLPTPFFFNSRVITRQDQNKVFAIFAEYLSGWWELFRHFWFLFYALESILFVVLVSFLATIISIIGYSVLFYAPRWLHEWRERTGGILREWVLIPLILWLLFLLPLWSQGMLWGLIIFTFLFWAYYTPKERLLVGMFILLTGVSFLFLPYFGAFQAAKSSLLLKYMVSNQRNETLTYLPNGNPVIEENKESWVPYFILSGIHANRGEYDEALMFQKSALTQNPKSSLILNNLGNIYYYLKSYDKAVESYQAALKANPSDVRPLYNMSHAFREKLLFQEAERRYHQAEELDQNRTGLYTRIATDHPSHPVVDGYLTMGDLWKKAIDPALGLPQAEAIWKILFGPLSIGASPFLAIGWALGLFLQTGSASRARLPSKCQSCACSICYHCQRQIFDFKVCGTCWNKLKTIRKRTEVYPHIHTTHGNYRTGLLLSLLPGGGHLYLKETFKGTLLIGLFFIVIGYTLSGGIFHPNLMWPLDDQQGLWVPIALGLLYLISLLDIWRSRSWREI